MKLLRFGDSGHEKPGILDDNGDIRSLEGVVDDIAGDMLDAASLKKIKALDLSTLALAPKGTRIGPCVGSVGKFICIGLNYSDHAAESGMQLPSEPEVFTKATSAICGPDDDIIKPKNSTKMDWEVELALVIGKEAKYVSEDEAEQYVAGYCVCNDVSERAFQLERGSQ
jgi:2,4-diketo-3-deoxy-L-fuconate hydrolase